DVPPSSLPPWSIGVVKELIPRRDGLICSVMLKIPNGNIINRAIQSLRPTELREDRDEDIEIENPEPTQEPDDDPSPLFLTPEIEPAVRNAVPAFGETDNVVGEVEPDATGSSG
ncbi:Uncharacterized protein APZ42_009813, partial [Daphnia magna]